MAKMNSRAKRRRAEKRRTQRNIRLRNEKIGPIVPKKDTNGDWTLKNNIQHLVILKSINNKWDKIAGIRRHVVVKNE